MPNLNSLLAPTATLTWRMNAVRLAVESGMMGQAQRVAGHSPHDVEYRCVSASEPRDHVLHYNPSEGTVSCDCRAGEQIHPCKHAGAVLLLVCHLAPERSRDAEGYSHVAP